METAERGSQVSVAGIVLLIMGISCFIGIVVGIHTSITSAVPDTQDLVLPEVTEGIVWKKSINLSGNNSATNRREFDIARKQFTMNAELLSNSFLGTSVYYVWEDVEQPLKLHTYVLPLRDMHSDYGKSFVPMYAREVQDGAVRLTFRKSKDYIFGTILGVMMLTITGLAFIFLGLEFIRR